MGIDPGCGGCGVCVDCQMIGNRSGVSRTMEDRIKTIEQEPFPNPKGTKKKRAKK